MSRSIAAALALPLALLTTSTPALAAPEDATSLRVVNRPGERMSLEVSIRDFVRADGEGPVVSLVGVTHIGDAAYYAELERVLGEYDVVLYESVAPPGAAGATAGATTPGQLASATLETARFLGRSAANHVAATGVWPQDLASLSRWAGTADARLGDFVDRAGTDGWGRPFDLLPAAGLDEAAGRSLIVRSLGRDGAPGGTGLDADILVTVTAADRDAAVAQAEAAAEAGGGIQADLAEALGLAYQLTEMDYDRPNFIPSDMAIDEVNRAMVARGGSMEFLEGTLDGSSLPARVAKVMLGVVKFADRLTNGAASTSMKVMLVEMLGDESLIDMSLAQVEPALGEVIVGERNRRVMDDLERLLADRAAAGETGGRIAIFYGAAHMPDFEERLAERFDYAPRGEPRWLPAISIDFRSSPVSERELNQIRTMVRRQMQMMQRMQPRGG
jgi:hypothetical protein